MIYLGENPVGLLVNNPCQTDTGTLTIDSSRAIITVQHNLKAIPDFAMIEIAEPLDANKIPYGSCIFCIYGYIPQINMQVPPYMTYNYIYRHKTSGNFLSNTFSMNNGQLSATEFQFSRGQNDWPSIDTDGNPIKYRWMVGKLNREVTPNA